MRAKAHWRAESACALRDVDLHIFVVVVEPFVVLEH